MEQPQPQSPLVHLIDPAGIAPGKTAEAGMWNCLMVARVAFETLGSRVAAAQNCTDPKTKKTADAFAGCLGPVVPLFYEAVETAIREIKGPQIVVPDHTVITPDQPPQNGRIILP